MEDLFGDIDDINFDDFDDTRKLILLSKIESTNDTKHCMDSILAVKRTCRLLCYLHIISDPYNKNLLLDLT